MRGVSTLGTILSLLTQLYGAILDHAGNRQEKKLWPRKYPCRDGVMILAGSGNFDKSSPTLFVTSQDDHLLARKVSTK